MTVQLRPRRIYWRPAEGFVGFGRHEPDQPDLLESEYRVGWWIVVICRVCLLAERKRLLDELTHAKDVIRRAKANVGDAIGIVEKRSRGEG